MTIPGPLHCLTENATFALAFLITHFVEGAACLILAGAAAWALRRTRPFRIALIAGLKADSRRAAADLFASSWLVVAFLALLGVDKLLLLSTVLWTPYVAKVVMNVVLTAVMVLTAFHGCRLAYKLRGLPTAIQP